MRGAFPHQLLSQTAHDPSDDTAPSTPSKPPQGSRLQLIGRRGGGGPLLDAVLRRVSRAALIRRTPGPRLRLLLLLLLLCAGLSLVASAFRSASSLRAMMATQRQGEATATRGAEPAAARAVVVATRFFGKGPEDLERLRAFVERSAEGPNVTHVLVAVKTEVDLSGALAALPALLSPTAHEATQVFGVEPWGGISHSLNALLYKAKMLKATDLLLQSPEINAGAHHIDLLLRERTQDTLCVGFALPGHIPPAELPLDVVHTPDNGSRGSLRTYIHGLTIPWNTLAVWDVEKLSITGFLACSDHLDPPGMEEAPAMAMLQRILPKSAKIKLLHFVAGGIVWDTDFSDAVRYEKHRKKMASKAARVQVQMEMLGESLAGTIEHIKIDE
mmetsp:Transcript_7067/g.26010  ORF Transcript_7067/g.26010 Transcript_7067/m.26010 type:complete len:387 (-) Transcript_7067:210-1370(-)